MSVTPFPQSRLRITWNQNGDPLITKPFIAIWISWKRRICFTVVRDMIYRVRKSWKRRKNSIWLMLPCGTVFSAITRTALLPVWKYRVLGTLPTGIYSLCGENQWWWDWFCSSQTKRKIYVQVTQEINSEKTEKREYNRLLEIPDNYPKFVLTTDEFAGGNYEGIKTMHIADFLLSAEYWHLKNWYCHTEKQSCGAAFSVFKWLWKSKSDRPPGSRKEKGW